MRPRSASTPQSPVRARWMLLSSFLVLLGCIAWVLWARQPQHRITETVISTNEPDDQLDLVERAIDHHLEESILFGVLTYGNTKLFSSDRLETELLALFPRFATVEASVFNQQLVIEATLRRPVGLWCVGTNTATEDCWFFDRSMIVYSQAPRFSEGVYIKYSNTNATTPPAIGEPILDPELRMHMARVITVVRELGLEPIRVTFQSSNVVRIFIQRLYDLDLLEEAHLIITEQQSPEEIHERIQLLLATPEFTDEVTTMPDQFAYADLRFPSRLVYKMNDEQ